MKKRVKKKLAKRYGYKKIHNENIKWTWFNILLGTDYPGEVIKKMVEENTIELEIETPDSPNQTRKIKIAQLFDYYE